MTSSSRTLLYASCAVLYASYAHAHAHHNVTEIDESVPIDGIIYLHGGLQTFLWGISFPIGMVLGLSKSKYHVPLQSINTVLCFVGMYFGHHHGGRQYPETVHGLMAKIITWVLVTQVGLGIFLKLHILEKTIRPWIVPFHSFIGKVFPILGWTQMLFGVVTALGYCRGGHLGQCAAHYIMGSAFIGYAAIMVIMLQVGHKWLERTGRSQEMLDSSVIMVWGIINTFTEHHGGPWTHKDMQHTMMGVLWWAGGMLGIWLSRNGKRSFVPAVIIIMTGWGMSAHEQALMISSKIHGLFGYALIAAGTLRLIEVCFVLNDKPTPPGTVRIFQHLPPYVSQLSTHSYTLFMSATDEELRNADGMGIDHVSYALFDFSLSFLLYLIITFLVALYSTSGKNAELNKELDQSNAEERGYSKLEQNGHAAAANDDDDDGPEAYELAERESESDEGRKVRGGDEIDWMHNGHDEPGRSGGVRL
ncbi:membrane protein [Kwoniella mangroviensis CBS 10435]|uniref:Membrane protein n=1 Tax=Kwoniella mangroviensis CBS 10435 TaxID=1331196 RepID=A0A1B9IK63_9TREE|nr:membrane protein [Kwoniella mangroviensis CBS 10435]